MSIKRKVIDKEKVVEAEELIRKLLFLIGENPDREGLVKTPYRVIKSYEELFAGYAQTPEEALSTVFKSDADEMVFCNDIQFYSICEHHMLSFSGKCHIGYIPDGKVVGLSKLVRVVDVFASRLQIQENMTSQIADSIMRILKPKGVGVVVEAQHFCMKVRGVKNHSSYMKTSKLMGVFKKQEVRSEFFNLIK